jgi:RNA polymerase sigma-70 factor (ECF subfamily)
LHRKGYMNNALVAMDFGTVLYNECKVGVDSSFSIALPLGEQSEEPRLCMDLITEPPDMSKLLTELSVSHDKGTFSLLFAHFAPRLKSMLLGLGSNAETAEELAQEAMISVWRKCEMYDPTKAAASTWIFAIARNLRIDRFRKEKRPEFDPHDPALIPDPQLMADEQLTLNERQSVVKRALEELPFEQRDVVKLSFVEGLSHQEISDRLQLPLGTVKSRLRLSFNKLRTKLRSQI